MTQDRRKLALAVGLLALLLGRATLAQDLETMEGFAPPDLSTYGSGPLPKQGYFFAFDGLWWSIGQPDPAPIGYPGLSRETVYNYGYAVFDDTGQVITGLYRPVVEVQQNSHDTGPLGATKTLGNRIEFGRVYGHGGWLFSGFQLQNQTQNFESGDVDVAFADIPYTDSQGREYYHLRGYSAVFVGDDGGTPLYLFGDPSIEGGYYVADLPITFDELYITNRVETWGVELMYLSRVGQTVGGGFLELFAGMRYLEFNENFDVQLLGTERLDAAGEPIDLAVANARFDYDATPSIIGPGVVLADSIWSSTAENHIIGPQIGGRWFRKQGHWTLSVEGRFLAGLNLQNIRNKGVLGSFLGEASPWDRTFTEGDPVEPDLFMPFLRQPYTFDNVGHLREWSPGGELRIEAVFDLTRSVSFKAGWSALWIGGIARGNVAADYVISEEGTMGVDRTRNTQDVLVNGLTIGLTINR